MVKRFKNLLVLGLSLSLLAGCSFGPVAPVEHVCRSCQPYEIKGNLYEPQRDYSYDETGQASWYGPGFHGRPKAYGERYDQHDISAAHRTLPLPTVVRVTNLENGKSLKMVVDDRGPYYSDRIIDLSYGAAKELGTVNKGLGHVRVESLIDESRALSKHLGQFGWKGIDPNGRTWNTIYREEIAPYFAETEGAGYEETDYGVPPQIMETVYREALPASKTKVPKERPTSQNLVLKEVKLTPPSRPQAPLGNKIYPSVIKPIKNKYFIEVGHYLHKHNAYSTLSQLRPVGKGMVKSILAKKRQQLYAVRIGPFASRLKASNTLKTLRAIGYSQAAVKGS